MSIPASSITRAEASISSSGSIVSCITPMRNGTVIAASALALRDMSRDPTHADRHAGCGESAGLRSETRAAVAACASCGFEADRTVPVLPGVRCRAAADTESHEQRKTVTVVFCDLAGSTALGESVDPERLRALLAPLLRADEGDRRASRRQRGEVHRRRRDGRVRRARRCTRTTRCARCERPSRCATRFPSSGCEGRIGVMTGRGRHRHRGAARDRRRRQRRGAAGAGGGAGRGADRRSRRSRSSATRSRWSRSSRSQLKGKAEPVSAYRLLHVRDAPERRHDAPFVGRERELALLRDALERVRAERRCELVTVVGDAGVGKSRLVAEAAGVARRDASCAAAASPTARGSPTGPSSRC